MPHKPVAMCSRSGCENDSPCPKHGNAKWSQSQRRSELPDDWREIRQRILERDGYQCTFPDDTGERCTAVATDVHHTGDKHDHRDEHLASACSPHHKRQTGKDGRAAQR